MFHKNERAHSIHNIINDVRVKVTELVVIYLHSLTHRMQETKKVIDLACILPEIGKVT